MAIERTRDFTILPGAYRSWERFTMPGRIEDVIDAVFALPDPSVRYYRVASMADLWCLEGIVAGWLVRIFGSRDERGRWSCVREVQPNGRS